MKKFLLAGVASIALLAGAPAHAADLGTRPAYKTPPAVAPVPLFTWTGCYIGAHIGGGWGRKEFSDTAAESFFVVGDGASRSIQTDTSGFLGGGQVGCDYQFAPNWVVGIQGDFSGADIKSDVIDPFFRLAKTFHARTDWLASVTGRIGWAWDRWMIYAKGGVAWAGDKYHVLDLNDGYALDASETRTGWTAGAGVEWAFLPNWSAFLEYDFYGFGHRDLVFSCHQLGTTACFGTFGPVSIKQDINVVKFGINWRFDWGKGKAPVVARY